MLIHAIIQSCSSNAKYIQYQMQLSYQIPESGGKKVDLPSLVHAISIRGNVLMTKVRDKWQDWLEVTGKLW